jgi:hypothetical protein
MHQQQLLHLAAAFEWIFFEGEQPPESEDDEQNTAVIHLPLRLKISAPTTTS